MPWRNQVCASRLCLQSSHPICSPTNHKFTHPDVEDSEGMSTPTEERGDLLIRHIWKHQTDCSLTCVLRILMHHPTFIENLSHECEKERKILGWTNAGTSLPVWFHVTESQGCTTKPCRKPRQETGRKWCRRIRGGYQTSCSRTSIPIERAKHLCIRQSRIDSEWANIPSGKMEPASTCYTVRLTTNISQIWHRKYRVEHLR